MCRIKVSGLCAGLILVLLWASAAPAQDRPDERLFREAKVQIFDKNWEEAQRILENLIERFPESPLYSQALFYLGETLKEQEGREKEALEVFKRYILRKDRTEILLQEAETSIIELAARLYEKGQKSYLKEIATRLFRPDRVVRYYAAFKMSYVEDKKEARKAIPVLKEILEKEKDDELKDKAKIALLRIDPESFKQVEEETGRRRVRMLKIRVTPKWGKEPRFSLNIPWALADLALANIPEEAKQDLLKEGYDLDRIIRQLEEAGEIIRIETKDSVIKIWID